MRQLQQHEYFEEYRIQPCPAQSTYNKIQNAVHITKFKKLLVNNGYHTEGCRTKNQDFIEVKLLNKLASARASGLDGGSQVLTDLLDDPKLQKAPSNYEGGNTQRPEVCVVTWNSDELATDALPINGFEHYKENDFVANAPFSVSWQSLTRQKEYFASKVEWLLWLLLLTYLELVPFLIMFLGLLLRMLWIWCW
ncbi:hypothetical protein ACET3Z_031057 [Daucus carota]